MTQADTDDHEEPLSEDETTVVGYAATVVKLAVAGRLDQGLAVFQTVMERWKSMLGLVCLTWCDMLIHHQTDGAPRRKRLRRQLFVYVNMETGTFDTGRPPEMDDATWWAARLLTARAKDDIDGTEAIWAEMRAASPSVAGDMVAALLTMVVDGMVGLPRGAARVKGETWTTLN